MRYKMYIIIWTIALTALFCITSRANATDYSVRFGPGIQGGSPTGSTKMFGVRSESHLIRGVYSATEVGGYVDNGGGGRSGAGIVKVQFGVKPGQHSGLYGFGFVGPCVITATDTQLSTHTQFATDIGLGVRDMDTFMSVGYSHISNAGIALPNKGRDYLLFSVGVSI